MFGMKDNVHEIRPGASVSFLTCGVLVKHGVEGENNGRPRKESVRGVMSFVSALFRPSTSLPEKWLGVPVSCHHNKTREKHS